jgi:hypothetical protein
MRSFVVGHCLLCLLCGGVFGVVLTTALVFHYVLLAVDGKIISTFLVCEKPYNNRCDTNYLLRTRDGMKITFHPVAYEFPRAELDIGTVIRKDKWSLSYEINDKVKWWSFYWDHIIHMVLSCLALSMWFPYRRRTLGL